MGDSVCYRSRIAKFISIFRFSAILRSEPFLISTGKKVLKGRYLLPLLVVQVLPVVMDQVSLDSIHGMLRTSLQSSLEDPVPLAWEAWEVWVEGVGEIPSATACLEGLVAQKACFVRSMILGLLQVPERQLQLRTSFHVH